MSELLLLPRKQLDGPQHITVTLRPRRVAYLVDPVDPAIALAAIDAACLEWGGEHHFLIPCDPGGAPTPMWAQILEKHDPDIIVDLIGAATDFLTEQQKRRDRLVHRWERPTETMELVGPVVYGPLRRWSRLRPQGPSHIALNLHPLVGHSLALPLAFRFGHLDLRPMDSNMTVHASYESARHRDFVDLREVDPRPFPDDELVRLVTEVPLDLSTWIPPRQPGLTHYRTLPDLTTVNLPTREPAYWRGDGAELHPEHEQHDEAFFRRLVVVGAPASVLDLCLAWNLRAQRHTDWFFPRWVSPEWLADPGVVRSIEWAVRNGRGGLSEEFRAPTVHLISTTIARDELTTVASGLITAFHAHDSETLDRFFTAEFRAGWEQPGIVNFRADAADVPLPDQENLGDFWQFERLGWTVSIDGYVAPRLPRRTFPGLSHRHRLAADGLAGFVDVPWDNTRSFISVRTSDGWEIVTAVAAEAGYEARVSDKGRLAIAVMGLLGNTTGYSVLASSRVYALLRSMAEIVERQAVQQTVRRHFPNLPLEELADIAGLVREGIIRESQFDRQHYAWDRLRQELGEDVPVEVREQLVDWLVTRRILLQGYESTCPNCGLRRWYPINRLSDTRLCDGCQSITTSPITVDQLKWSYRLNELVARAIDQGVLPHILSLRRMAEWTHDWRAVLLGILPGIELTPQAADGPPKIEIDLFAIKGGRVVVGECKAGGDRLTDQTVERHADLGRRLAASRIVYATPADFDADRAALERAKTTIAPLQLEIWEAAALLDSWGAGLPKRSPDKYLQELVDVLLSPM